MADIFLSYARADRSKAEQVKAALEGAGLSVFFDVEGLDGGDVFPDVLDREVKTAGAVVSLWSPHALSRPWVKQECSIGLKRKCLIPLMIEPLGDLDVPVAFEGLQQIDFTGFHGRSDSAEWGKLMRSLARTLGRPDLVPLVATAVRPAPASGPKGPWPGWPKLLIGMAGSLAVIAAIGSGYRMLVPQAGQPIEKPVEAAAATDAAPTSLETPDASMPVPAVIEEYPGQLCSDLKAQVFFEFDKTTPAPASIVMLEDAVTRSFDCVLVEVRIEAHDDLFNSPPYAQRVSERRAGSLSEILIAKGVNGAIISTIGYGSSQPLETGKRTPMNRRADVFFDFELPPSDAAATP